MTATDAALTATATGAITATRTRKAAWRSPNAHLWVLQALLAAGYLMAAAPKLAGDPTTAAQFAALGFGAVGVQVIGGLELAGAVALLVPRLCGLAAAAFVALMVGAVAVTVTRVGVLPALVPAVYLVVAAVIAWARRDRTARLAALALRR